MDFTLANHNIHFIQKKKNHDIYSITLVPQLGYKLTLLSSARFDY